MNEMNEWMNEWMNDCSEWINELMNRWINKWITEFSICTNPIKIYMSIVNNDNAKFWEVKEMYYGIRLTK